MNIDEQKKETMDCVDQDIMCTLVFAFLFSKYLMIPYLMAILNTIMF